jgi:UDP-N-acetylmuramoylalanine-D-glutamate ligase
MRRETPQQAFPAGHGNAAGPIRMLKEGKPNYVVAFPGGPGTRDMVNKAKAAGVPVVEVADDR